MHGSSWIALFKRIPVNLHDSMALTLVTGSEIIVQAILRLEDDFALMRGRTSGCTDAPRILVMPYHQIVNIAITRPMLEKDVRGIFGELLETPAALRDKAMTSGEPAPAQDDKAELKYDPPAAAPPAATPPAPAARAQIAAPSKSILLARLRARLSEQTK